jgi:hypothetical protein
MYIEDIILALFTSPQIATMNSYDSNLILSLSSQIVKGLGLSEKQGSLSVKILKKQLINLNTILHQDITTFLDSPKFRTQLRIVNNIKSISIIAHETYGKIIRVKFPYNETIVNKIRKEKHNCNYVTWNPTEKTWEFALTEQTLLCVSAIADEDNFIVYEEFREYQKQIADIKNNMDRYIPMVVSQGRNLKFVNISDYIKQPTGFSVIETLFYARRLGIFTWDDHIANTAEWQSASDFTKKFLQTDPMEAIELEEDTLTSLNDIIINMTPTLFVIPGGTELEKLKVSLNFLKTNNIANEDISVMFRLPKETGEKFNEFIKENKLNSPIHANTKVVFVSGKIPKPVIEKNIHFNSVINFNFYNIHHSIKNFVQWHNNVINIKSKKVNKIGLL